MRIDRFEDLECWQAARELVKFVYAMFSVCRDYAFRDQIQRAAVSVMSNIAEGFDRGGNKEFLHFLTIARGSLAEVKSLAYAATDLGYLSDESLEKLSEQCSATKGLVNGLIRYLRGADRKR
ncbi:MAG: four helix bundle protein [Deferrisomatales bacterium]|nr:four helix bundle protein [Deferrisomatales bacterium]